MANAAALISLAASYEKRFGRRARLSALHELARHYGELANAASAEAVGPVTDGQAGPIIAHLLSRIASLKREVIAALAQPPALPAADVVAAGVAQNGCAAPIDVASAWQLERGDMPLLDWIRKKARKDMLTMSEQDLAQHLQDLERIRQAPWGAVAGPDSSERVRRQLENDYRRLRNEIEAALHIGWLLQEEFPDAWAHVDTEAMLLERMTAYECAQYEVRKENARRRQEFRRKKPGVFGLAAQEMPAATPIEAIGSPRV